MRSTWKLLETMPKSEKEESIAPYTLKNTGSGFDCRQSDVFGSLDALEQKHLTHEKSRTDTDEFSNLNPVNLDHSVDTRRGTSKQTT